MKLFTILKLTGLAILDIAVLAVFIPMLINSGGTLGMILVPLVIVLAGYVTVQEVKKALKA